VMAGGVTSEGFGPVRLLVVQPTTLCNLDCRYCYLPLRRQPLRMSLTTLAAAMKNFFVGDMIARQLKILWHAGEPLTLPVRYYEAALRIVEDCRPAEISVVHAMQTNGTLINETWCQFIKAHGIRVGLSIDGPEALHDKNRRDRNGRGTWRQIQRAIALLKEHRIPFGVIAVLTSEAMQHHDALIDFFSDLGAQTIGFNTEETQGVNSSQTYGDRSLVDQHRQFIRRIDEAHCLGRFRSREISLMEQTILDGDNAAWNEEVKPFHILTMDYRGLACTFSPELAGMQSSSGQSFALGDLTRAPLPQLVQSDRFRELWAEIHQGREMCRRSCGYFDVCGGGAPSNKYFENGSFCTTETMYCKLAIKNVADVVLPRLEHTLKLKGEICPRD
jgi:uncharacterized protein